MSVGYYYLKKMGEESPPATVVPQMYCQGILISALGYFDPRSDSGPFKKKTGHFDPSRFRLRHFVPLERSIDLIHKLNYDL